MSSCTDSFVAAIERARLRLFSGRLRAASFRDQAEIDRALADASLCHGARVGSTVALGAVAPAPIVLHVVPIGESFLASLWPEACALVIAEPSGRSPASSGWLRDAYGLTDAEIAVASLLGDEPAGTAGIARTLGIAVSTVRTHLHRVFEKTGTHRQADLVRLIVGANGCTCREAEVPASGPSRQPRRRSG